MNPAPKSCSRIVKLGGCDRYGYCTVRLADGVVTETDFAIEGKTVCYPAGKPIFKWHWLFFSGDK